MVGLGRGDNGDQAAFDEVDVLDRIVGRFEHLARLEVHHFDGGL